MEKIKTIKSKDIDRLEKNIFTIENIQLSAERLESLIYLLENTQNNIIKINKDLNINNIFIDNELQILQTLLYCIDEINNDILEQADHAIKEYFNK